MLCSKICGRRYVKDITNDSEVQARIVGVQAQMKKFELLFGLVLGIRILKHTDNLSKTFQSPELTVADGQFSLSNFRKD